MSSDNPAVLAVVPARGGSKGVPRKNLRLLGGTPLITHTLRCARASELITHLVVSTDDPEIASVAREHNVGVPFLRPPELATDEVSQLDVILHALAFIERAERLQYEVVLLLQPTAPLRTTEDIDNALRKLFATGADSVVSFYRVEQGHPYYMYTLEEDRPLPFIPLPPHITRRQQFPAIYSRNGAIYATRREVLVNTRSFYGDDVRAYLMPIERSINIDTELDLRMAECLLRLQRAPDRGKPL